VLSANSSQLYPHRRVWSRIACWRCFSGSSVAQSRVDIRSLSFLPGCEEKLGQAAGRKQVGEKPVRTWKIMSRQEQPRPW
jgi:hypothetical protein